MGQLHEMVEKEEQVYRIARKDFLDTLGELMPYLHQRREVARMHYDRPGEHTYELMQDLNKEIAKILSLF